MGYGWFVVCGGWVAWNVVVWFGLPGLHLSKRKNYLVVSLLLIEHLLSIERQKEPTDDRKQIERLIV